VDTVTLFYASDRTEWRAWLEKNHTTAKEVWLLYYKRHTKRPRVPYDEAVEEALSFGWIDGMIRRIDDATYAQRFTPRKPGSTWSDLNRRRVARLVSERQIARAGLAKVDFALPDPHAPRRPREALPLPDWLKQMLVCSPRAWANFENLPPCARRNHIGWISAAKREETRKRRVREAIELLERNERLGMK
jgi:uncharacterized protein YdeI (YjbR/CyaY-like superfamily)